MKNHEGDIIGVLQLLNATDGNAGRAVPFTEDAQRLIADIFEALTAKDRPYKTGKPLSECLAILARMKQDGHIDPGLFDVFVREKVYLRYAKDYLDQHQIDEVDAAALLGPDYAPGDR